MVKAMKNGAGFNWQYEDLSLEIILRPNNEPIIIGKIWSNDLVSLELATCDSQSYGFLSKPTLQTWHERLGHVNTSKLFEMKKNKSVIGLDFTDEVDFCKGCALSKVTKSSFKTSNTQTKEPGDLVFMDMCSASPSTSLGGAKYFLLLNHFTKYRKVYFLKVFAFSCSLPLEQLMH